MITDRVVGGNNGKTIIRGMTTEMTTKGTTKEKITEKGKEKNNWP